MTNHESLPSIEIRFARIDECNAIWKILKQVIATGESYVFNPDSDKKKMLSYWCGDDKYTYVAVMQNEIVGTFIIKDNQPDLGSHVANASYMVLPEAYGKGIGYAMGKFSLDEARRLGYKAMQFNIVVQSNEPAIKLWQKLGFEIVGEIPDAFDHQQLGFTNGLIMWRRL